MKTDTTLSLELIPRMNEANLILCFSLSESIGVADFSWFEV